MKKISAITFFALQLICAACHSETESSKVETDNKSQNAKTNPDDLPTEEEPILNEKHSLDQDGDKIIAEITPASQVALDFMNAYATHCDSMNKAMDTDKWIRNNQLITSSFKITYKKLLEDAFKADPELGLDADPIFDAQDFPDKGFVFINQDKDGFVNLQGKDWPEFKQVVKVVSVGNKWLVDGAGIINIPESKRAVNY